MRNDTKMLFGNVERECYPHFEIILCSLKMFNYQKTCTAALQWLPFSRNTELQKQ